MSETTDDACRVRAVAALDLAGNPPEAEFEALAALAAQLLDCPIAMITLIDHDLQWIAASSGSEIQQTPRSEAFCNHTIRAPQMMAINDALADPRFADVPLVNGPTAARAYVGLAVSACDPQTGRIVPVGAVCALDTHVREFAERHREALTHLRTLTESLFAVRRLKRQAEVQADQLRRSDRAFRQAERMAKMGSWRLELETENVTWSDGVYELYDMPIGAPTSLTVVMDCFTPAGRPIVTAAMEALIGAGTPFDLELDFVSLRGRRRRIQVVGELEASDGRPVALFGVVQDITARHDLEESLRRSANRDGLTGIANRAAFNGELARWTDEARREGTPLQLAMIDLDLFKQVNDRHGHLTGDAVLRAFGRRLQRAHPTEAFAARIGGDEFALILRGDTALQMPDLIATLLMALKIPVRTAAGIISVSGTIGYAAYDPADAGLDAFIHRADSALYHAKRTERGSAWAWGPSCADDQPGSAGSAEARPVSRRVLQPAWLGQQRGSPSFSGSHPLP